YNVVPFGSPSGQTSDISITFDDGYKNNLTLAAPLLLEKQYPFTVFVIAERVLSGHPDFLSKTELVEMSKLPDVTIGTHGWSHNGLSKLSIQEAQTELTKSKNQIEDWIGKEVTTIS